MVKNNVCQVYFNKAISFVAIFLTKISIFFLIKNLYCILRGRIKGFNSSITAIMCQVGSYRTVVGSYRMVG